MSEMIMMLDGCFDTYSIYR